MLVEMDGFTGSTGVVVLAGTNRVDILDNCLAETGTQLECTELVMKRVLHADE